MNINHKVCISSLYCPGGTLRANAMNGTLFNSQLKCKKNME